MRLNWNRSAWIAVAALAVSVWLPGSAGAATPSPCEVPQHPSGAHTVQLPPIGCDYLSPDEVHAILDALPDGSDIEFAPIHKDFICGRPGTPGPLVSIPPGLCEDTFPNSVTPTNETFTSTLKLTVTGNGTLSGVNCMLTVPNVAVQTQTAPRQVGQPVQRFATELKSLSGTLAGETACGLFDTVTFRAGALQSLPASTGETILVRNPGNGTWNVDSFFDITYEIEWTGKSGGPLDGESGTAGGSMQMRAGVPVPVPTLSGRGLFGLAVVLAAAAAVLMYRRRRVASGTAAG